MQWLFVAANGQQFSCNESDVPALVQAGQIHSQTLMWREGLSEWVPAGTALPGAFGTSPAAAATQPMDPRPAAQTAVQTAAQTATQRAVQPTSRPMAPAADRSDANVVRYVTQPLMRRKGWIKFFGVTSIIYGVLSLLPLGWMMIWAGLSVMRGIGAVETAQRGGDPRVLAQANDAFGRGFVIMAVMWLISLVFMVVVLLIFGAALVAMVRDISTAPGGGGTPMEFPQPPAPQ
jgi:hypothetical protein